MIRDTVSHLRGLGRRVFLDAEHFFDGYRFDPAYAIEVVRTAIEAGAEVVALCDTNGGMLPAELADVVHARARGVVRAARHPLPQRHRLRGRELAGRGRRRRRSTCRARSTATASAPATPTCSRSSRTSSSSSAAGCCRPGRLAEATRIAHAVSEITNVAPYSRQPYVGASAFAHKAGLHASAIRVDPDLYQHAEPTSVGNDMRMLVSDMAGRASIELKGRELGFDLAGDRDLLTRVTDRVKRMEAEGYTFEAADASFALLLHEEVDGARVGVRRRRELARHHRVAARRRGGVRGDGQADRRRRAVRRDRRGQRPGQRAGPRAAQGPAAGLPGAGAARARRLQGAHPRRRARHGRRSPACSSRPATTTRRGRPSASARTSSRRRGRRWSTGCRSGCCGWAWCAAEPAPGKVKSP